MLDYEPTNYPLTRIYVLVGLRDCVDLSAFRQARSFKLSLSKGLFTSVDGPEQTETEGRDHLRCHFASIEQERWCNRQVDHCSASRSEKDANTRGQDKGVFCRAARPPLGVSIFLPVRRKFLVLIDRASDPSRY